MHCLRSHPTTQKKDVAKGSKPGLIRIGSKDSHRWVSLLALHIGVEAGGGFDRVCHV